MIQKTSMNKVKGKTSQASFVYHPIHKVLSTTPIPLGPCPTLAHAEGHPLFPTPSPIYPQPPQVSYNRVPTGFGGTFFFSFSSPPFSL